jgi:hypothetical protein
VCAKILQEEGSVLAGFPIFDYNKYKYTHYDSKTPCSIFRRQQ